MYICILLDRLLIFSTVKVIIIILIKTEIENNEDHAQTVFYNSLMDYNKINCLRKEKRDEYVGNDIIKRQKAQGLNYKLTKI